MKPVENKVLVFAHVPPPLHGQSVMVEAGLSALRERWPERVSHVDARWSGSMAEIGAGGWRKALLVPRYVIKALRLRFTGQANILYYVPGPVKLSAVLRDWVVLAALRPFFDRTVFHWHAVGQGEWSAGSGRVVLGRGGLFDRLARRASAVVLGRPALSLVVSPCSDPDARAVESGEIRVVDNGLVDPCPDFVNEAAVRRRSTEGLRILFLSVGTREKGVLDAVEAVGRFARGYGGGRVALTLAGGLADDVREEVLARIGEWKRELGPERIAFDLIGFVTGTDKCRLWREHDLLLFPSHWESFGLVAVEAMAWGLPVVAAASDGARGVLGDGYPWLAPVGDTEGLARALAACRESLAAGGEAAQPECWRGRYLARFGVDGFRKRIVAAVGPLMEGAFG